ncbi:MAG: SUMF1/EgtB/PvdO family nonheme iron enzyme [Bacteroidales bacterium]|nr:SUMF1/EgtB/PvdO family nonheme iron enzyme [Bacteroidales bacterium]
MRKIYWLLILVLFCNQLCKAQNNKEITVGDEIFTMIFVEGGTFTMGATVDQGSTYKENEKPCHKVTLSDFYIGQFEVTQALWVEVMGYNPSMRQEDMNYPVENVSWGDCMEFINKLNEMTGMKFRLPTESEWEFAARGGNQSKGYKYPGSNNFREVAWSDKWTKRDDWGGKTDIAPTHPVGGKKPNELGIYDLATNVAEWCYDAYEIWPKEFAVRPQTNPTGPDHYSWVNFGDKRVKSPKPHVVRGFGIGDDEFDHRICRRDCNDKASPYTGFRLALDL